MNFEPELFKWYKVYTMNKEEDYRLFFYESSTTVRFMNVIAKYGIVEPGVEIKRFLKQRGPDYRLAKGGLPRYLQKSIMAFIFEGLDDL